MGNSIESLRNLLSSIRIPTYVYLHDYYTCCPQYNLLKNDEYYCNPLSIRKCDYCKYFETAQNNRVEYEKLFDDLKDRLTVIAPSQKCAEIWQHFYPEYRSSVRVILHQKMILSDSNNQIINQKLRMAFIGRQEFCKGWSVWKMIVELINKHNLPYDLYYFGTGLEQLENVKNSVVVFKAGNTNAMIEALKENQIDVVALLSNWPETYSYTLYEAIASNCYVLTNNDSGNIEHQVKSNGWGTVYSIDSELEELILDYKKMQQLVIDYRKKYTNYFDVVPNSEELIDMVKNQRFDSKIDFFVKKRTNLSLRLIRNLKKLLR